ncbi:hypothetical protein GLOIN_2v1876960 [Rhizophagus clarus]|uniref:F-box domain-containing protein n=1 Tax=Rhizophagus clarus TaxID=94130 RepID=A0A8H3L900_9GLOM|nr:hypothetical protein GLOIN_2v1876960 [Rhizophagus clarus]
MPYQLPADCLDEIFDYLEEEKFSLHSCLLVNRFWCVISVRILWKNVLGSNQFNLPPKILDTLISCLPNVSKELLHKNEIFTSTLTSKPPLFNYASFCKVLSIRRIDQMIQHALENQQSKQSIISRSLNYCKYLLFQEILKMFMKQIPSLKELRYNSTENIINVTFTYFPGAIDCLTNLTVLNCSSDIYPELFYQLSQICYNIQSLTIEFESTVSNGLKDLISSQHNLKHLSLIQTYDGANWTDIIPSLIKHSKTLVKLKINGGENSGPLSFITDFINLEELVLSFHYRDSFCELNKLQYIKFPKLQILKFPYGCPRFDILIKFLEISGRNLKEFYIGDYDNSLNLAIAKFCPNLKSLFTIFMDNELETLKLIFNQCQLLESVRIWCGYELLREKDFLETLAKYSPKNFRKLRLFNDSDSKLVSKDLEEFFVNWKNRVPQKSLHFTIIKYFEEDDSLEKNDENMKIIEKYEKLDFIYTVKEKVTRGNPADK